jgi:hypothetical protein
LEDGLSQAAFYISWGTYSTLPAMDVGEKTGEDRIVLNVEARRGFGKITSA